MFLHRTPSPPGSKPRALSRQSSGAPNSDSFVCNVSDDQVIERDVDLEIEARIRATSDTDTDAPPAAPAVQHPYRSASVSSQRSAQPPPPSRRASAAPAKSTLSSRMLSALQRKKSQASARTKRSGSVLLEVVQAEQGTIPEQPRDGSNHSMGADIDGLVVPDPLYDPSQDPVYMSDDENATLTHGVPKSCKDRLEARISERLHQNKSNLSARPDSLSAAPTDSSELSVVYTNRRTYPAESGRKMDTRYSDNHLDTRFDRAGVTHEQRVNNAGSYYQQFGSQQYHQQPQQPPQQPSVQPNPNIRGPLDPTIEILNNSKSLPVAFHFQGQNGRAQPPAAPVDYRDQQFNQTQTSFRATRRDQAAAPRPTTREPPRRDDQYRALILSVEQIEQVVDGLENCFAASSFSSLASVALRELELLRDSTKQIRTNGTTLILAEVGHSQSQMLGPCRQLVARAAQLQNRIEMLIQRIRTMC